MTEEKEPYVYVIASMQKLLLPMRQVLHRLIVSQDGVTRLALQPHSESALDAAFSRRDDQFDAAIMLHKDTLRDVEEARRIARREHRRAERFLARITELTMQNDQMSCDLEAAQKTRHGAERLKRKITALITAQHMASSLLLLEREGRDVKPEIDLRLAQRDRIVASIVAQYTGVCDG